MPLKLLSVGRKKIVAQPMGNEANKPNMFGSSRGARRRSCRGGEALRRQPAVRLLVDQRMEGGEISRRPHLTGLIFTLARVASHSIEALERLVDALKWSRVSGIPIEKFAGEIVEAERPKETK